MPAAFKPMIPSVNPVLPGAAGGAGGAGGGGSYGDIMQSLLASLNPPSQSSLLAGLFGKSPAVKGFGGLVDQANKANSQRGQAILQLLQGGGDAAIGLNQQNFEKQTAGIDQDLMNRGLFNSTISSNLKQEAQNQLAQNNALVKEQAAGNIANMGASFNQQAPDLGIMANLMAQGGGGAMTPRERYLQGLQNRGGGGVAMAPAQPQISGSGFVNWGSGVDNSGR